MNLSLDQCKLLENGPELTHLPLLVDKYSQSQLPTRHVYPN